MNLINIRRLQIIRVYLYLSCLVYLLVFWVRIPAAYFYGIGHFFGFSLKMLVRLTPMFAGFIASAGMLWLSYSSHRNQLLKRVEAVCSWLPERTETNIVLFILPMALYPLLRLSQFANAVDVYLPNWWLFGHAVLLSSIFAYSFKRKYSQFTNLVITALIYGVVYQVMIYSSNISTYPLSMGWPTNFVTQLIFFH
jgi:hypothetical protein